MKRGSSVLQPPCDAAKRPTDPAHAHTQTHTGGAAGGGDARSLSVSNTHTEHAPDTRAAGSSPFPAATSLFSPDVSTKMASDLLIRLSEATQKAQVHPGSQAEAEPQRREVPLEARGGQQDEPGQALSPDGPGASPEPPSLTHTPDGNAGATDTLASELLRQLAERQEVNFLGVRVKEEEEPVEVDMMVASDLVRDRPAAKETTPSSPTVASHHRFTVTPDLCGNNATAQSHPGAKMAVPRLPGLKMEDGFFNVDCQSPGSKTSDGVAGKFQFRVKMEEDDVSGTRMTEQLLSGAKMEDQFLIKAKLAERPFSAAKTGNRFLSGVKTEEPFPLGLKTENGLLAGAKMADRVLSSGAKMEEQLFFGAKMEDQCLRAVLWQDMSVNLASTLLHQLSERVSKSNNPLVERSTPPTRSSPVLKLNGDLLCSPPFVRTQEPSNETQTCLSRDQTTGYFYRCHVCGFETEGCGLFQSHMTGHRQWERGSFSLHCCACDHSTNQEAEMRAHADSHVHGDSAVGGGLRCPITPPASASSSSSTTTQAVAVATPPERSTSEHRCRICQRSFPGQQELLVHFQGHRQGNQYRCDRCGHLTRTANKLVEHVRVHTGERPFTCHLCPYSAKRRDSLRLHCKVKHAAAAATHVGGNPAADAPGDVHTHRSYAHGDNQRSNKHVQRLHTPANTHTAAPSSSSSSLPPLHPSLHDRAGWRDLSPLLPITTLISLKPRAPSPPSSAASSFSSSTKHSFLSYLGLTSL